MENKAAANTADTVTSRKHDVRLITLRALSVKQIGPERFEVALPTRTLSAEEAEMVQYLFPNTEHIIGEALTLEALFSAASDGKAETR